MLILSITNLSFIEPTAKNSGLRRRQDSPDTGTKTVGSAKPGQGQKSVYKVSKEGNWEWDGIPYGILSTLSGPALTFFGYQYWHYLRVVMGCHLGYNMGWMVESMFRKYDTEQHYNLWINLTFQTLQIVLSALVGWWFWYSKRWSYTFGTIYTFNKLFLYLNMIINLWLGGTSHWYILLQGWVFGLICGFLGWYWPSTMVIYGTSFIGAQGFFTGLGCLTEQFPKPTNMNQAGYIWWIYYFGIIILTLAGVVTQQLFRRRMRLESVDLTLTLDLGQTDIWCGSGEKEAKKEVKEIEMT